VEDLLDISPLNFMFALRKLVLVLGGSCFLFCHVSCRILPSSERIEKPVFLPSSERLNTDIDTASIEELVLTLPVEPLSKHFFHEMVTEARKTLPENRNANKEFLFIGGDGNRGENYFELDRKKRRLKVTSVRGNMIPPITTEYFLYYVPDGWIQSQGQLTPEDISLHERFPISTYWEGVGG
jgi:hypothetical protein